MARKKSDWLPLLPFYALIAAFLVVAGFYFYQAVIGFFIVGLLLWAFTYRKGGGTVSSLFVCLIGWPLIFVAAVDMRAEQRQKQREAAKAAEQDGK